MAAVAVLLPPPSPLLRLGSAPHPPCTSLFGAASELADGERQSLRTGRRPPCTSFPGAAGRRSGLTAVASGPGGEVVHGLYLGRFGENGASLDFTIRDAVPAAAVSSINPY